MEKLFCHLCDHDAEEFEVREEEFSYNVRNEEFTIKGKRVYCVSNDHVEELFHKEYDSDNQRKAFNLYREKYGILFPEEIINLRKKYNLKQREFSYLLGFGEITISRYERGSLPTPAQNQILKDSEDPEKMMGYLVKNSEKIGEEKSAELRALLTNLLPTNHYEQSIINEIKEIFHHVPDAYSGYKEFDFKKFSSMVLFFSKKDRPYLTKLNKLMFYADYYFFQKHKVSLSGAKYIRDYYGPVPEKFQTLYDNIEGVEIIENEHGSYTSSELKKIDDDLLNEQELEILNFVYEKYRGMYSSDIKDFSHEEKCWIETQNKNLISYTYAEELDMNREYLR